MLQCVEVCCSVLQYAVVWCSVVQCRSVWIGVRAIFNENNIKHDRMHPINMYYILRIWWHSQLQIRWHRDYWTTLVNEPECQWDLQLVSGDNMVIILNPMRYEVFPYSQGTAVCLGENLFEILGTPMETCLKVTETVVKTCWNFGCVIVFSPISLVCGYIATHCNTLQHTAIHCNTLQHTATHCNTHRDLRRISSWQSERLIRRGPIVYSQSQTSQHRILRSFLKFCKRTRIQPMGFKSSTV